MALLTRPRAARLSPWIALAVCCCVGPASAQSLTLVTTTLQTTSAGASAFARVAVSADGRYVAFCSAAKPTDMVAGKVNGPGASNVYVRDRLTGLNELITVSATDPARSADGACAADVQMTPDGRYVAFRSTATNLLTSILHPSGEHSGFVWDRVSRTLVIVDVAVDVTRAAGAKAMVMSENGRFVAFSSAGSGVTTQLIPNFKDQNGPLADLYLRDLQAGRTRLISRQYALADAGAPAGVEMKPLISPRVFGADGQVLLFTAEYAEILPNMSALRNLYAYDWRTDAIALVSVSALSGTPLPGNAPVEVDSDTAGYGSSADGRHAVFTSAAQLTLLPTGGRKHVYLRDLTANTTTLVTINPAGNAANGDSTQPVISRDGAVIVFESLATDLVDGFTDTGGFVDVFARPRAGGPIEWLTRAPIGLTGGNERAWLEDVSADGRYVSWRSAATNYLLPGTITDTNGADDLFVRDRVAQTTSLRSIAAVGNTTPNAACVSSTLLAGGVVALFSEATNLIFTPVTTGTNIFAPPLSLADVSVEVTDAPDPASVGQLVTYTYTAANAGPAAATGVLVSAPVPPGATFVTADGGATPAGGTVTFNVGTVSSGARVSRTMSVRYAVAGTATAAATTASAVVDPVSSNNTASASTTINSLVVLPAISGLVRDAGNSGLPNVTVVLTGGASRTAVTAADGTYLFTNLPSGANYTVTPSAADYAFTPAALSFTGVTTDQRADFTGTPLPRPAITGQVRDSGNATLPGVTVTLTGGGSTISTTGADGTYAFTELTRGASYVVTPSATGYVFTPASASFTDLTADRQADFLGACQPEIAGVVRDGLEAAVPGVTIALTPALAAPVVTDADGRFSIPGVAPNQAVTLTAAREGFTFAPASQTVTTTACGTAVAPFVVASGQFTRYFAEGATTGFFDTSMALLNASGTSTTARLTYQLATGVNVVQEVPLGGLARATVNPELLPEMANAEFSTVIESSQPVIADRTMHWDATGYGSHAETSVAQPLTTWYLAEGATIGGFSLFYLIQNPADVDAQVQITYLLPAPAAPITKSYTVPGRTRQNVWVNVEDPRLANAEISAIVSASVPVIVERAMYLDRPGQFFAAGHESAGVPGPAPQWFFAEGATGEYFDLFYLIANPGTAPAVIDGRYLLPNGTVLSKRYTVAGQSRFNIWADFETFDGVAGSPLADTPVSASFTAANGVSFIAERAMWWRGSSAEWFEGHNAAGALRPGTRWALADGEAGGDRGTEAYILIANVSNVDGTVRVTFVYEDGTSTEITRTVGANSRTNVAVGPEVSEAAGRRFGAIVESLGANPALIVVERAMYNDSNGLRWAAGTNSLGTRLR